jgi:hypothetical protein
MERLYIHDGQARTQLIKKAHGSPTGGHLGVHTTHESLHHLLYWPKMFHTVHQDVCTCMQCLRNKSTNQQPMGLLQPPCPFLTTAGSKSATIWSQGCQKRPVAMIPKFSFVDRLSSGFLWFLQQVLLTQLVMQDCFITTFSGILDCPGD